MKARLVFGLVSLSLALTATVVFGEEPVRVWIWDITTVSKPNGSKDYRVSESLVRRLDFKEGVSAQANVQKAPYVITYVYIYENMPGHYHVVGLVAITKELPYERYLVSEGLITADCSKKLPENCVRVFEKATMEAVAQFDEFVGQAK